jgi:hypothetical protein
MCLDQVHDSGGEGISRRRGKPEENDATYRPSGRENELAEVPILRYENALLANGQVDHSLVRCPRRHVDDGGKIVTPSAERANDGEIAALIGEKVPLFLLLDQHGLLMRKRVRGICEGRQQVFRC